MLTQLTISQFAIVRELEIDFRAGMSAITGETGAGKSIAIDALGLCLGNRADANMVRPGANRADICARFSLKDTLAARLWLEEHHWMIIRNACCAALSTATAAPVVLSTALPYRCHNCVSSAHC